MQNVLKKNADSRLRVYIIWIPMRPMDDRAAAEKRSSEWMDKRLTYFWDRDRLAGRLWQRVLNRPGPAWDIYLIYGADAQWKEEPAGPDFWMSNPAGMDRAAPAMNEPEFTAKIRELLGKIKSGGRGH